MSVQTLLDPLKSKWETYTQQKKLLGQYPSTRGYCSICEKATHFVRYGEWLRDDYRCIHCDSIPRFRGLIHVLQQSYPKWRELHIHESSPGSASSTKIQQECAQYTPSQFWSDRPLGSVHYGTSNENLECLTFANESFDLHITQDVFEHVLHPDRGFAEIARTLKPGGAHIFTVPVYKGRKTLVRVIEQNGELVHLEPPDYHGNPIDPEGSLVIREWGEDITEYISQHSGLETEIFDLNDRRLGLEAEFLQVYVSRKRM